MLEAISFKENNIMSMRLLLSGGNQTSIWSKETYMWMQEQIYLVGRGRGGRKEREREREREREITSSVELVPVHP